MPRALWSGSLSFGLVNVPVQVVPATRDLDFHFRQLHEPDGAPIEQQRWCSKESKEVDWSEVARSYEFDDGKEVVVDDEELDALAPERTKTIDIEQFVELAAVDPILFDRPYWLVPGADDQGALRAYQLLVEVMGETERAALGRFVLRTKERLALVRVRDSVLLLETLRFPDEVRDIKGVERAGGKTRAPSKEQLDQAVSLIEALSTDWDPKKYKDEYRKRLEGVVRKKKQGKTIKAPPAGEPERKPAVDLMAALEESLAKARGGKGKKKKTAA